MQENIFHNPTLISYVVKTMKEKYPGAQVGKTVIQNLLYLISKKGVCDFDYSLYHYGPYSSQVSSELNFAEDIGAITIDWIPEKGYFISLGPMFSSRLLLQNTKEIERDAVNKVVQEYGSYNAIELSIIATALFLKENFRVKDQSNLEDVVSSLRPQYDKMRISTLLANRLHRLEIKTIDHLQSKISADLAIQVGSIPDLDHTKSPQIKT
jgi:hypothetical protein